MHPLIITQRPLQNLLATNCKLRAAWGPDLLGHIVVPEQRLPRLRIVLFAGVAGLGRLAEGLDLRRTSGRQLAAQINEPLLQDKVTPQRAHRLHVAVVHGIRVPGDGPAVAVAVQEDDDGGEVVVVVDDELEVGEGLTAFVFGSVKGGGVVVDRVDEIAPSIALRVRFCPKQEESKESKESVAYDSLRKLLRHPRGILLAQLAHDNDALVRHLDRRGLVFQGDRLSRANAPFPATVVLRGCGLRTKRGAEGGGIEAPGEVCDLARGGVLSAEEDEGEDDEHGG